MKIENVHVIVSGTVQGVGFRYFVRGVAERLGVRGWVRNREDGAVEIEAEADKPAIDSFLAAVERGNAWSSVDHMDVTKKEEQGYAGFEIED